MWIFQCRTFIDCTKLNMNWNTLYVRLLNVLIQRYHFINILIWFNIAFFMIKIKHNQADTVSYYVTIDNIDTIKTAMKYVVWWSNQSNDKRQWFPLGSIKKQRYTHLSIERLSTGNTCIAERRIFIFIIKKAILNQINIY